MTAVPFTSSPDGLKLRLHLQPGAKTSGFAGLRQADGPGGKTDTRLVLRLTARAKEGEANEALLTFLATTMKLPKSSITLESGATSRLKTVFLKGCPETLAERLMQAAKMQTN